MTLSPSTSADGQPDAVEMPATFEELGELTFAEALEAFDDRYEEHVASEEERVRNQADPNWRREVIARRKDSKVGVKYSEADLASPPEPYPVANYSRKWEVEHDLLEIRHCISTASELIEEFTAGTSDRRHYGHACTLEQAVGREQDSIDQWEEELKPLEWELAWLNSSTAFDFTGESCQSDLEAMHDLFEEGDVVNFQVYVEQESCPEWFDLTKEQITFMRKLDRAIYHAGDAIVPEITGTPTAKRSPVNLTRVLRGWSNSSARVLGSNCLLLGASWLSVTRPSGRDCGTSVRRRVSSARPTTFSAEPVVRRAHPASERRSASGRCTSSLAPIPVLAVAPHPGFAAHAESPAGQPVAGEVILPVAETSLSRVRNPGACLMSSGLALSGTPR